MRLPTPAQKAALLRLTDSLAEELHGTGIFVFAMTPGFVRTAMIERIATSNAGRRFLPTLAQRQGEVDRRAAGRLVVEIAPGRLGHSLTASYTCSTTRRSSC